MKPTKEVQKVSEKPEEKLIPMDGFQQILDMMEVADESFRESLISRLQRKNPQLAQQIRRHLITI